MAKIECFKYAKCFTRQCFPIRSLTYNTQETQINYLLAEAVILSSTSNFFRTIAALNENIHLKKKMNLTFTFFASVIHSNGPLRKHKLFQRVQKSSIGNAAICLTSLFHTDSSHNVALLFTHYAKLVRFAHSYCSIRSQDRSIVRRFSMKK